MALSDPYELTLAFRTTKRMAKALERAKGDLGIRKRSDLIRQFVQKCLDGMYPKEGKKK